MTDIRLPRPTTHCNVKDCRSLADEKEGYRWLGPPLSESVVSQRYPSRSLLDLPALSESARSKLVSQQASEFARSSGDKAYHAPAVAHFAGFWADEQEEGSGDFETVYVDDFVKINVGSDNCKGWSIAQVKELYQTPSGERMMKLQWFYACHDNDTSLNYLCYKKGSKGGKQAAAAEEEEADADEEDEEGEGAEGEPMDSKGAVSKMAVPDFDQRQVFRARDNTAYQHEYVLSMLESKVEVVYVQPDEEPPADCQFWWTFEFDRRFLTFEVPPHVAEQQRRRFEASRPKGTPLILRGMDLYAGAGGLGYLDYVSELPKEEGEEEAVPDPNGVQTRTDWACDYEEDMGRTFKANFNHSHVFISGTDELLEVCKATFELYHELKMDAPGQPVRPYNGGGRYPRCDDDKLLAWPRSVQLEVTKRRNAQKAKDKAAAKKAERAAGNAHKRQKKGATAAEASLLESEAGPSDEGEEVEEEEVEETEEGSEGGSEDQELEEEQESRGAGRKRKAPSSKGKQQQKKGEEKRKKTGQQADEKFHYTAEDKLPYHGKVGKVREIRQMRLGECAPRLTCSNVHAGLLKRSIEPSERWLEFKVVMENGEGEEDEAWLTREQLRGQDGLLRGFVRQLRERQCIPFPGEVDFICGGPPCQGISGNNRHAVHQDILNDPRNRQLPVFISYTRWFKPKYVLMENVMDILKKENGKYIKYAMGSMLNMRYQVRTSLIAAGNFGVPQGRWRCFMWAAAPGQQLPGIPKPTHNCVNFQTHLANSGKRITSGFCGRKEAEDGYPPVVLGDIFSDLPPVDNYDLHERRPYHTGPQRITQAWLRRDPKPWMTPREERFKTHEDYMLEGQKAIVHKILSKGEEAGLVGMAVQALSNGNNPLFPKKDENGEAAKRSDEEEAGKHAFETLAAALRCVEDPKIQVALWLQCEASRAGYNHELGQKLKRRLLEYLENDPKLRENPESLLCDHRAMWCNTDDLLRLETVPTRQAGDVDRNFRDLEGIAVNRDGTCCYGHSHAPRKPDGTSACAGGGSYEPPKKLKKGTHPENRVDHHDKDGWRGGALLGCSAYTHFMPTGNQLVPRWCVTFKGGQSRGRGGCFGRFADHEIVSTVVGRAEPHNLKLGHPRQPRTVTARENARMQGFPDFHVLMAKPNTTGKARFVRNNDLANRYQQLGNAVCPLVAAALGRCLAMAALHQTPPGQMLLSVPDPEYDALVDEWRDLEDAGDAPDGFFAEEYGVDRLRLLDNIVAYIKEDGSESAEQSLQPAGGSRQGQESEDGEEEEEEEEEEEGQQKQQQKKQQQARCCVPAPPAAATSSEEEEEWEDDEEEDAAMQQQQQQQQGAESGSSSEEEDESEEEQKEDGSAAVDASEDEGEEEAEEDESENDEEDEEEDSDAQFVDAQEDAPMASADAEDVEMDDDEEPEAAAPVAWRERKVSRRERA